MSFSEWKEYKLSDIAQITMGQSPKGTSCNKEQRGMPLLNGPTEFGTHHPEPTQFTEDTKKLARKGDLLFCVRGSTTGRMNWAEQDYAIGRGIAAIAPIHNDTDRFIKAMIDYKLPEILQMATGSTFPNVSKSMLNDLVIKVPNVTEMANINNIFKCIEDKIEINNQINKTLEEMAQAIFKQWFVDFEFPNEDGEPYKSSDGEMVESELGMIPKGWEVKGLSEVCHEITRGITPKYIDKSDLLVLNQKVNKGEYLEKQYYKYFNPDIDIADNKRARKYDVLINSLGQGTLGRVHYYLEKTDNVLVDQHISIIRPVETLISSSYIYLALKSREYQHRIEASITGSTGMLMLNISKVRGLKILVPDKEINKAFADQMQSVFNNKIEKVLENEVLSKIRDTLLAKLMSGEIRVPLDN